jgi:CBS-domain-containing membrane protein
MTVCSSVTTAYLSSIGGVMTACCSSRVKVKLDMILLVAAPVAASSVLIASTNSSSKGYSSS